MSKYNLTPDLIEHIKVCLNALTEAKGQDKVNNEELVIAIDTYVAEKNLSMTEAIKMTALIFQGAAIIREDL